MKDEQIFSEIKRRWEAWSNLPFPSDVYEPESLGFDLTSLDTFSAGCISVFVGNRGKLDRERIVVLSNCAGDLDKMCNRLSGNIKEYFTELSNLSHMVLEFIKGQ